jgi:hypothetical protein
MIEKELQNLIACKENTSFTESKVVLWAKIDICKEILSSLDTLEVKEVNLEEEIKRFTMSKELYEADSAIKAVAEHFFELGLKTQKGE